MKSIIYKVNHVLVYQIMSLAFTLKNVSLAPTFMNKAVGLECVINTIFLNLVRNARKVFCPEMEKHQQMPVNVMILNLKYGLVKQQNVYNAILL